MKLTNCKIECPAMMLANSRKLKLHNLAVPETSSIATWKSTSELEAKALLTKRRERSPKLRAQSGSKPNATIDNASAKVPPSLCGTALKTA